MKILFIVTLSELGGAQKYVRDLALAYAKAGHTVSVAAGPDQKNTSNDWRLGWLFRELTSASANRNINASAIQICFIPHLKRSIGLFREFRTLFEIISIIRNERPDVIHLNSTKIGGIGGLAGRLMNVKTVYTVHGLVLNEPLPKHLWILYWFLEKLAFALCHRIIVLSNLDQQRIIDLKLAPARKLSLIPLTIDPDALNFLSREEARNNLISRIMEHVSKNTDSMFPVPSSMIVGTIANFYPAKDLATLIDAARIVMKEKPDITFVMIGDGPQRTELVSRIMKHKLQNNVFLLGAIENASRLIPGLDLFILSSIKEGLPQVLQESVAAGAPIVSTNVGGIPDLAVKNPRHPWILCDPNNPRLLAENILFALEHFRPNTPKTKETLEQEFLEFTLTTLSRY